MHVRTLSLKITPPYCTVESSTGMGVSGIVHKLRYTQPEQKARFKRPAKVRILVIYSRTRVNARLNFRLVPNFISFKSRVATAPSSEQNRFI